MTLSLLATVEALKTQGAVTVEGVFSQREMEHLRELIGVAVERASQLESWRGGPAERLVTYHNGTLWNVWEFYILCPEAMRYTRHPAILWMLESAIGRPVINASAGTVFDKVPGGQGEVGWHQDSFMVLVPPEEKVVDSSGFWGLFGRFHVRPDQMIWNNDYYRSMVIVRINVDPQTTENGCLLILPGSHLEGPFELKGMDARTAYIEHHQGETVACTGGEGSVTFYYPGVLHSSAPSAAQEGTHRRVIAHRMRVADLRVPDWEWPTDWEGFLEPALPVEGFDLNPFADVP
jgi:ectoine hydroxylase-related dioxygenase (phytanoyl-CoA dioxygenase family)